MEENMYKKKSRKTKKAKEEIPAPLGATAPALNERVPDLTDNPEIEEQPKEDVKDASETIRDSVFSIPGLSAKMKFEIVELIQTQIHNKSKKEVIESVTALHGVDGAKKKTIEKILNRDL